MTSPADQTIAGSYRVIQIDGEDVALHRVGDKWVTTQERLDRERDQAFMNQFTDYVPGTDHRLIDTNVERKPSAGTIQLHGTSCRLEAYLVEMLGDPGLILAGDVAAVDRLRRLRAQEGLLRHALGLIAVFNNPTWNQVRDVLVRP